MQLMLMRVIPQYAPVFSANYAKNLLHATVILQYAPRIFRFVPLLGGQSANGFIFESAWANFVMNLVIFVLAGHVVGSCWYHFGLQVSLFVYINPVEYQHIAISILSSSLVKKKELMNS
jgi:cyclic nucleotide gated channel